MEGRLEALPPWLLPELIQASKPHSSQEDYLEWHVFRRAGGLGLVDLRVTAKFGGMMGWRAGQIRAAITRLAEKCWLVPVAVEELPRQRFYIRRDDLPALEAAAKSYRGNPPRVGDEWRTSTGAPVIPASRRCRCF